MDTTCSFPQTAEALVNEWHEAGREKFNARWPNLNYDDPEQYKTRVVAGNRWIKLDRGHGGHFVVDKNTGEIFRIKGYGVPNKKKPVGILGQISGQTLAQYDWFN